MIVNIEKYKKKLQFDKNKIYQYMFMEYVYFSILNNEDKLLKGRVLCHNECEIK